MAERVLGVDPGTVRMGYGLVESSGHETRHLASGALAPRRSLPLGDRLWELFQELTTLLDTWKPTALAVEEPYVPRTRADGTGSSVRSAMALGQAEALVLIAAAARGIPVSRYAPSQIKSAVTNDGRGSKEQVQEMVRLILGLPQRPQPTDAADALAVALCHLQHQRAARLVGAGR